MSNEGNKCMVDGCKNVVESMVSYHVLCEYHANKRREDYAKAFAKQDQGEEE
jgi:hypothetical protein|tara:strand:+ start:344 stop:499 length:156 start_codon:yes stop_codon:yes gene_type:complete